MNESTQRRLKKVAVVSGSRADAGLLFGLMHKINEHPALELQIFITGSHLSQSHGSTYQEFKKQRLTLTDKIPMDVESSGSLENCTALGEGIINFAKCYKKHTPDLVVVLGDRFEILAAVQSAMMVNIPIAHLHGGELSLGSLDDRIRHAITKMAQLHFPATDVYAKRIIQMGELPARVFNVGATTMDNIKNIPLLTRVELERTLKIKLLKSIILVTWHPETASNKNNLEGLKNMLTALDYFKHTQIIITKANADSGGITINQYLENYVEEKTNYHLFTSLGNQNYLSLLQYVKLVVGNSSSALFEVAAMRVASVNIGSRQDSRFKPDSVVDCSTNTEQIIRAIEYASSTTHQQKCNTMLLPYGKGNTCKLITEVIHKTDLQSLHYKPFYEIEFHIK